MLVSAWGDIVQPQNHGNKPGWEILQEIGSEDEILAVKDRLRGNLFFRLAGIEIGLEIERILARRDGIKPRRDQAKRDLA